MNIRFRLATLALALCASASLSLPAPALAQSTPPPTCNFLCGDDTRTPCDSVYEYHTLFNSNRVIKTDGANDYNWAGSTSGIAGYLDAQGNQARFNHPWGICPAPNCGQYVADSYNQVIRRIDSARNVTTIIGAPGVTGIMTADTTPSSNARFNYPMGVAGTGSKHFFVADTYNHAIYYVNRNNGIVYLVCGQPGVSGFVNGSGRNARFNRPRGLKINAEGDLLTVEDWGNDAVRFVRLYPTGTGGYTGCASTLGVPSNCP